ncbi:MAG TPA: hypothetical protein VMI56_22670 [Reyranella sp.]|nr:hypothetical protein [Reyranella sp.]
MSDNRWSARDPDGHRYRTLDRLDFRLSGDHPGLLGIVCDDVTCWIHGAGIQKFFRILAQWREHAAKNPDIKDRVSSFHFRASVAHADGAYEYRDIYNFAPEAIHSAQALIDNTWTVLQLPDPALATQPQRLVRTNAASRMAARGRGSLDCNHIALGLLDTAASADGLERSLPKGLSFDVLKREAAELESVLAPFRVTVDMLVDELETRVPEGAAFELPGNTVIMFAPDAIDYHSRLEKMTAPGLLSRLTGRKSSKDPTMKQMLDALLAAPTPEMAATLAAHDVQVDELRKKLRQ